MCEWGAGDKVGYILTNAELKIYWNIVVIILVHAASQPQEGSINLDFGAFKK